MNKEMVFEIEEIEMASEILSSTLSAIESAMYDGPYDSKTYEMAIRGVCNRSSELAVRLKKLSDCAFAALKAEKIQKKENDHE